MPKKFAGENTKAAAAKARKTAAKEDEQQRKEKEKEDEYWRDDDKIANRKQQRKEQQDKKKQEQLQKKAELKNLVEEEEKTLKLPSKQPASKLTRAQIQEEQQRRAEAAAAAASTKKEPKTHIEKPLEENINKLEVDGLEARSITEAISILSTKDTPEDKHPERRMKALYAAFEAANMPRLKEENPLLRLSQLKQLLFKEWQKSPENPLNQRQID